MRNECEYVSCLVFNAQAWKLLPLKVFQVLEELRAVQVTSVGKLKTNSNMCHIHMNQERIQ